MSDIFSEANDKISSSLIHSFFNSEGSYSRDGEYYILSPIRSDKRVGSFSINETTGLWRDYATNEAGDFIGLVSKACNISLKDAAERIIRESGGVFVESKDHEKSNKKEKKEFPEPLFPIPETDEIKTSLQKRVISEWCQEHWGKATHITRYFDEKGNWKFVVCRFEKATKGIKKRQKNDILFYLGIDNKWYTKWHESLKPFPLLGIQNLKDNDLPYLIVEGEKCQRVKVPGYNVISWIGGTSNISKSDWAPLRKREGFIWADADSGMDKNNEFYLPYELQPGMKAAFAIKAELPKAKILEIYRYKPIEENPAGFDIYDYVEVEKKDPVKFIKEYTPYYSLSVEVDAYQVYRKFIEIYYEFDSLEQAGGYFWRYDKERHYWCRALKNDIFCNFNRWLEVTGLQWVISKKVKATTFINDVKQYISAHSLGYISENPFKDAALSPYIHLQNGAIKIGKKEISWLPRGKYEEAFFKNKYPINCLDFEFDFDNYKTVDAEKDCPAFYHVIKDLVPRDFIEGKTEKFIKRVTKETLNFISQIFAYSLSPIKMNEYVFGIYGNERTGKSFLIKILKSIVGKDFCVERKIADMDNRFAAASLWGKKVFIEPDLKTRQPLPEDFIKAYSGEQEISVEEKNMPTVDGVKSSLAMFFISNYEFHAKGIEGLSRRLIMVPYKNTIANHDAMLLDKILGEYAHGVESGEREGAEFDERPAILALAMQSWEKFCQNEYKIQIPEWVQEEKDTWMIETNTVAKFLHEQYLNSLDDTRIKRTDLHDHFKNWCSEEGRKPLGKKNFYEEVRREARIKEHRHDGQDYFDIDKPDNSDIPF